jgi:hypothetical protein
VTAGNPAIPKEEVNEERAGVLECGAPALYHEGFLRRTLRGLGGGGCSVAEEGNNVQQRYAATAGIGWCQRTGSVRTVEPRSIGQRGCSLREQTDLYLHHRRLEVLAQQLLGNQRKSSPRRRAGGRDTLSSQDAWGSSCWWSSWPS